MLNQNFLFLLVCLQCSLKIMQFLIMLPLNVVGQNDFAIKFFKSLKSNWKKIIFSLIRVKEICYFLVIFFSLNDHFS